MEKLDKKISICRKRLDNLKMQIDRLEADIRTTQNSLKNVKREILDLCKVPWADHALFSAKVRENCLDRRSERYNQELDEIMKKIR